MALEKWRRFPTQSHAQLNFSIEKSALAIQYILCVRSGFYTYTWNIVTKELRK